MPLLSIDELLSAEPPSNMLPVSSIRWADVPLGISRAVVDVMFKFSVGAKVIAELTVDILLSKIPSSWRYTLPVPFVRNSKSLFELVVVITLSKNCTSVLNSITSNETLSSTATASTLNEPIFKFLSICRSSLNNIFYVTNP